MFYFQHEIPDSVERSDVIKSQKTDIVSFAKLLEQKLCRMQGCLRQYNRFNSCTVHVFTATVDISIFSALATCSVELLLKVGTLLPEMAVHEKSVDYIIQLLRKDQV